MEIDFIAYENPNDGLISFPWLTGSSASSVVGLRTGTTGQPTYENYWGSITFVLNGSDSNGNILTPNLAVTWRSYTGAGGTGNAWAQTTIAPYTVPPYSLLWISVVAPSPDEGSTYPSAAVVTLEFT